MADQSTGKVVESFMSKCAVRTLALRRTLDDESDRGAALMAAAFLDVELESLLTFIVVNDSAVHERFFGMNGPCGSFSARIDAAYLLGLISKPHHRDLTLIRRIRNDFAHVHEPMSFESSAVRARCGELSWYGSDVQARPREHFLRVVMMVVSSIHTAYLLIPCFGERTHHPKTPEDEKRVLELQRQFVEEGLLGRLDWSDPEAVAHQLIERLTSQGTSAGKNEMRLKGEGEGQPRGPE